MQKYVFQHYMVWEKKLVEKDDPTKLSTEAGVLRNLAKFTGKHLCQRKRKDSGHYEEGEAPVKFVSKVEKC